MTSYFDDARRDAAANDLDTAIAIEGRVVGEVNLVTGDREFPDDLREKIQGLIAIHSIETPIGRNEGAVKWFEMMKESKLIEELHRAFHTVGSRRVETRFGLLTDHPKDILIRRDDHDLTG